MKELRSIRADPIMMVLVVYAFSVAVYTVANGATTEARDMTIGIVDEDHSTLSRQLLDVMKPPLFRKAVEISVDQVDPMMDAGQLVFVLEIPPRFERDLLTGHPTSMQLNVDATAMTQAGNGSGYIENIVTAEITKFLLSREIKAAMPVDFVTRVLFNPNLDSSWFTSVMQVINNITMLTVILTGAALIREREQGTVEHLLVMPLVPAEIMLAKIIANSLVILCAASLSLLFVVQWWLQIPITGSIPLFLFGAAIYAITVATLGILLGTITSTMGQFGLLVIPILMITQLLSGSTTPMESMPVWLRYGMQITSPTPHFVAFAQGVLYRGADLQILWPELVAIVVIGSVYLLFSLRRFRQVIFGG
ncbi:ABC transporter permease [Beijerinckia mobilis]|uniref:ABC transporter permease n=1 Tax=Beijerinckia mobilis TaxID=231434 RepID=UPI001FDAACCB|nr:ABC transporter permease [Beijerinckia mobilis]